MKLFILNFFVFLSTNAFARSIKPSLDRISSELFQIGAAIGAISLMVAAIHLMSGKNDAGEKITKNLIGLFLFSTSVSVVGFFMALR